MGSPVPSSVYARQKLVVGDPEIVFPCGDADSFTCKFTTPLVGITGPPVQQMCPCCACPGLSCLSSSSAVLSDWLGGCAGKVGVALGWGEGRVLEPPQVGHVCKITVPDWLSISQSASVRPFYTGATDQTHHCSRHPRCSPSTARRHQRSGRWSSRRV